MQWSIIIIARDIGPDLVVTAKVQQRRPALKGFNPSLIKSLGKLGLTAFIHQHIF